MAGIAGDREDRDLIAEVLFARLRDGGTVRYRQEVFRDLDDAALLDAVLRFTGSMAEVRAHLRQLATMRYRYQREGWLLDAASIYCEAGRSVAGRLSSAQVSSRALIAFRDYLAAYASSARFTALADETEACACALGRVRYCIRVRGPRVEVSSSPRNPIIPRLGTRYSRRARP